MSLKRKGTWMVSTLAPISNPRATSTRALSHPCPSGQRYSRKAFRMASVEVPPSDPEPPADAVVDGDARLVVPAVWPV